MPSTKSLVAAGVLALGLSTSPALTSGPALAAPASTSTSTSPSISTTNDPASTRSATDARPRNGYGVRLTTFNILSSAMARGGIDRASRAARWVRGQGATVSAFQEVAKDQLRHMQKTMPGYNFFPRRTLGTRGSAIQIAWDTSQVQLVDTGHVMRPFLGWQRPIPFVRLRDRDTGRGFWVMAIHNAPGGHETERDISTAKQIAQIKKMLGKDRPVFVIGDVNERSEFCTKVARATPLVSMNGGTRKSPCPVPRFGGPDWMLGAGAEFSDFAKVYNGISDHPALTARAWVPSKN
jgi:endonuclease/exonuclease/phosphatase family metal-dependent hydrolase